MNVMRRLNSRSITIVFLSKTQETAAVNWPEMSSPAIDPNSPQNIASIATSEEIIESPATPSPARMYNADASSSLSASPMQIYTTGLSVWRSYAYILLRLGRERKPSVIHRNVSACCKLCPRHGAPNAAAVANFLKVWLLFFMVAAIARIAHSVSFLFKVFPSSTRKKRVPLQRPRASDIFSLTARVYTYI